MAPKNTEHSKYFEYCKQEGIDKLPVPDHEETIAELVAEGNRLLAEEEKKSVAKPIPPKKSDAKKLENALGAMSTNPFVRARIQILNKYPTWKRHEIEEMEKTGNINNPYYEAFVHDVRVLGEQLQG